MKYRILPKNDSLGVILSGPVPNASQSRRDSEESRLIRHGDSSLKAYQVGSWAVNPLRVTLVDKWMVIP